MESTSDSSASPELSVSATPYKPSFLAQMMAFVMLVSSLSGILLTVLYLFRGQQACDAAWRTYVRLVDEALDD